MEEDTEDFFVLFLVFHGQTQQPWQRWNRHTHRNTHTSFAHWAWKPIQTDTYVLSTGHLTVATPEDYSCFAHFSWTQQFKVGFKIFFVFFNHLMDWLIHWGDIQGKLRRRWDGEKGWGGGERCQNSWPLLPHSSSILCFLLLFCTNFIPHYAICPYFGSLFVFSLWWFHTSWC